MTSSTTTSEKKDIFNRLMTKSSTKRKRNDPLSSSPSSSCDCTHTNNNNNDDDDEETKKIRSLLLNEAKYDIDNPTNTPKRVDYLNWDDYFMALSFLSAQRSKDPQEQMGACIVDDDNRIVGIGYNGFPRGCSDDDLPWASSSSVMEGDDGSEGTTTGSSNPLHTKYFYMCPAEVNAVLNKTSPDLKGKRMYVPDFPCKSVVSSRYYRVADMEDDRWMMCIL